MHHDLFCTLLLECHPPDDDRLQHLSSTDPISQIASKEGDWQATNACRRHRNTDVM